MDVTRRSLIQILTAAPAIAEAEAQAQAAHEHPAAAPAATKPAAYQRKVFDDRQWRTLHVVCDLIIPADEHSGSATQAGVPEFIDDWVDFRKREDGNDLLEAQVLGGLMWVDQESARLFGKDLSGLKLMKGWRRELLGEPLVKFCQQKLDAKVRWSDAGLVTEIHAG